MIAGSGLRGLFRGNVPTAANTVVVQAPANAVVVIKSIIYENSNATARTVQAWLVATSATTGAATNQYQSGANSTAQNATTVDTTEVILNPGEALILQASGAGMVAFINGAVFPIDAGASESVGF